MAARKLIIDCDPGLDDAIALLLAFASPELEVAAVTTVAGNAPLAQTTRNALRIAELAGRADVPVHAGCPRPLRRILRTAEAVHGPTGLDGADLPDPGTPLAPGHAADVIVERLMAAEPGEITLAPTGPLTNVALALAKEPAIVPRIREIVLMGGAVRTGNATPVAEFNVHADPDAADIVFASGAPIVMIGLDATHQALATPERVAAIRGLGTPVARAVVGMIGRAARHDAERYGFPGAPLHDPCVVAWLLRPELFDGRRCHVAVETASELTLGQTVVDWWGLGARPPNALVVDTVDADGFFALLTERLGRY